MIQLNPTEPTVCSNHPTNPQLSRGYSFSSVLDRIADLWTRFTTWLAERPEVFAAWWRGASTLSQPLQENEHAVPELKHPPDQHENPLPSVDAPMILAPHARPPLPLNWPVLNFFQPRFPNQANTLLPAPIRLLMNYIQPIFPRFASSPPVMPRNVFIIGRLPLPIASFPSLALPQLVTSRSTSPLVLDYKPNLPPNLLDKLGETCEIQDSRRSQGHDLGEERSAVDRVLQPALSGKLGGKLGYKPEMIQELPIRTNPSPESGIVEKKGSIAEMQPPSSTTHARKLSLHPNGQLLNPYSQDHPDLNLIQGFPCPRNPLSATFDRALAVEASIEDRAIEQEPLQKSAIDKEMKALLLQHQPICHYLQMLPEELRREVFRYLDESSTWQLKSGSLPWANFFAIYAQRYPHQHSLPFSYIFLLNLGAKPLKKLNEFISPKDEQAVIEASQQLMSAINQYNELRKKQIEKNQLHELLLLLPYVGALQFISDTSYYHERCELMLKEGNEPPEIRLIRFWLTLRMKKAVLPLSFTTVSKRFYKSIGYVTPVPPYLLPLLPFGSTADSWKAGLADLHNVDQALAIVQQMEQVDLCLRLPEEMITQNLPKNSPLKKLISQFQKAQEESKKLEIRKENASHYPQKDAMQSSLEIEDLHFRWLKVRFPKIPSYLLATILDGKSLKKILTDPKKTQPVLALLRQSELLELMTLLPIDMIDAFCKEHPFYFDNLTWDSVLEKSRKALSLEKESACITPELAKELFFFDPNIQLNVQELERIARAPRIFLRHARYLSSRIAKEGVVVLENARKTQGFLPLERDEVDLFRDVLERVMQINGMLSAVTYGGAIALKFRNYLKDHPLGINPNIYASLDTSLRLFSSVPEAKRQEIFVNLHHLFLLALGKIDMLSFKEKMLSEIREKALPKQEAIRTHVQAVSQRLFKLPLDYPEFQEKNGKLSLRDYLEWYEKETELHEPVFGVGSTYGFRGTKTALCPPEIDQTISLDQILIHNPKTHEFTYDVKFLFEFLTHSITSILKQPLQNHPTLYSQAHLEKLPNILLQELVSLFPALKGAIERQGPISQEELIDIIEQSTLEGIEQFSHLLLSKKSLTDREAAAIETRNHRIQDLKTHKNILIKEFNKKISSEQAIIDANSSYLPWKTFSSEQQEICQRAEKAKAELIETMERHCSRIDSEICCQELQIEIIQKHAPPEVLDFFGWFLGLSAYEL